MKRANAVAARQWFHALPDAWPEGLLGEEVAEGERRVYGGWDKERRRTVIALEGGDTGENDAIVRTWKPRRIIVLAGKGEVEGEDGQYG